MILKRDQQCTYFRINTSTGQFVFHHHDDDAEHAHNESIIADPLPFFEKCLTSSEPVAHIGFVFEAAGRDGPGRALVDTAAETAFLHVTRIV